MSISSERACFKCEENELPTVSCSKVYETNMQYASEKRYGPRNVYDKSYESIIISQKERFGTI